MTLKIILCYHWSPYQNITALKKFIKHYKKYKAGIKHNLLICFKNLEKKKIKLIQKKYLTNLEYTLFIDPEKKNDFDFGSYLRVAKKYPRSKIFFCNSQSNPIVNKWLYKIDRKFKNKTIIACFGSYQSLSSNSLYRNQSDNYFIFFCKIIYFHLYFKRFPNPHLRSSAFYMKARDFIEYMKDKIISAAPIIREGDKHSYAWYKGKFDIFKMESGRSSLTEYFKKKNYKLFVINSKGDLYSEANWRDSNTYATNDQKYRMFLDKHTTKFSKLTKKQKKNFQKTVWGPCSYRQRILFGRWHMITKELWSKLKKIYRLSFGALC